MKTVLELKKNYHGGGAYRGGVERGKVSTLGRKDARIHRNLGESSCEDTIFSHWEP